MAEESQASAGEVHVTKVIDTDASHVPVEVAAGETLTNGGLDLKGKEENKEEEEETALDGEFIKVEKESLDVKDTPQTGESTTTEDNPSVIERSASNTMASKDLLEAEEKLKTLELEVERLAKELQQSESEKSQLKQDVVLAKEKFEERNKHYEELELNQKKLQEHIREAEEKYNSQLAALQEALGAQEAKHKELTDVKEAFNGLAIELESSQKKMQALEQQLQSSAGEARRFEELSKQSGSHAEAESQKATEFEKLLELARSSAAEMDNQMASLKEELKGLYEKVAENQRLEESLNSTLVELSAVQGELELSKSQVLDFKQKLASTEGVISELTEELKLRKASEGQLKEDILALENLFTSAKEDLQAKVTNLEEIELKLREEVKIRETVETSLKNQELQSSGLREELVKATGERDALEAAVVDLKSNLLKTEELCGDLEAKLKLSDDSFSKADMLLSQALSHNVELEEKIKSLDELHKESGVVAATASQRSLELEDIVRASSAAEEEAKSQLRDIEIRLISVGQRNAELEKQLNLAELKNSDADRELKEFSEKTTELTAILKGVEEESSQLKTQLKEYEDKLTQLESALSISTLKNSELEKELKDVSEKCAEHEGRASTTHQRSLELEDWMKISHSKAEDAGKKVGELELLLEAANYRTRELEEQVSISEAKCRDEEAESKKHSDKVAELTAELEAFQVKSSSLEIALRAANEKESQLLESLNAITEERKRFEDVSNSSSEKLSEVNNLLEIMQNELKVAHDKLEAIEEDLNASRTQESEILEKLKSAEEQLEQRGKLIEQATARTSELELLHESLSKESELKLREATESFTQRDSEAKNLYEKLKTLEDQVMIYTKKAAEATEREASLKAELKVAHEKLEAIKEDLNASRTQESEILEKLKSAEEQLEQRGKLIEQATARTSELELLHESLSKESELKLREATESFTQRDSEAKDLYEKLKTLEDQVMIYTEKAAEATEREASLKAELEESSTKLAALENTLEELKSKVSEAETKAWQSFSENELLAETNSKLKKELESHQIKINEHQELLSSLHAEKNAAAEQLAVHSRTITELTDQHSRGLELQSSAESHAREAELQLLEAIERFTQRDSEAKVLDEKRLELETQFRILEEQANEAAAAAEGRKVELDEALLKLKNLEGIVEELQSKSRRFETENEGLAEANLKLTQELAAYESKMNELQTALNEILVEKEETHEQLHSSKKTIEDLTQQLSAEGQSLQSQISSVMEENDLLTKTYQAAREELQAVIVQMEGQLNEQKAREAILNSDVENLKAELTEKSLLQTHIAQLEEQLMLAETRLKEEVESVRAVAAGKEAGLTSQLEEHARQLQERDALGEKLAQFEKELSLAHATIAEQKEADSRKELERDAASKHSLEELEEKHQQTVLLGKQVEDLEQKLQLAEANYKEKEIEEGRKLALVNAELDDLKSKSNQTAELEKKIVELENQLKLANTKSEGQVKEGIHVDTKDGVEVKSRDLGSSISTPSKRKSKKRAEATSVQAVEASSTTPAQATEEHSLATNIKIILGVALVSVIIGVILGKRY
ncbi:uncharacterized protein LOC131242486 [Magnolia sinica]|uniref:uncharacterized protein LOC131242486 n=1 Tax=Magnolia sinica TaxID=86752 RepID=UPI00265AE0F6|nr:uncharacterized protein LOC131242486 [Magnolia sinica]